MAERIIDNRPRTMHITFYKNGKLTFFTEWPFGTRKYALSRFVPKANISALARYNHKRRK